MGKMGRYCKAYTLSQMREFEGWRENAEAFRKPEPDDDETEADAPATEGDRVVYLQENYTVTDGIFLDENVIADNVTPEWIDFCRSRLNFEVPEDELSDDRVTADAS